MCRKSHLAVMMIPFPVHPLEEVKCERVCYKMNRGRRMHRIVDGANSGYKLLSAWVCIPLTFSSPLYGFLERIGKKSLCVRLLYRHTHARTRCTAWLKRRFAAIYMNTSRPVYVSIGCRQISIFFSGFIYTFTPRE
jgi:hypothetical protein